MGNSLSVFYGGFMDRPNTSFVTIGYKKKLFVILDVFYFSYLCKIFFECFKNNFCDVDFFYFPYIFMQNNF